MQHRFAVTDHLVAPGGNLVLGEFRLPFLGSAVQSRQQLSQGSFSDLLGDFRGPVCQEV